MFKNLSIAMGIVALFAAPSHAQYRVVLSMEAELNVYNNICNAYRGGTQMRPLLEYGVDLIKSSAEPGESTADLSWETINILRKNRMLGMIHKSRDLIMRAIEDDRCRASR